MSAPGERPEESVDVEPAAPAATAVPPAEPAPARPAEPSREERRAKWWAETKLDLKWATALLFVLILAMSGAFWGAWQQPLAGEENVGNVADAFFSQGPYAETGSIPANAPRGGLEPGLLAPFELLSVLLLAALVAGVVIAMRDVEGGL